MPPEDIEALTKLVNSRFDKKRYKTQLGYYVYGYMILLAIETGMRAAELCALKWSDIKENQIWIHAQILEKTKPLSSTYAPWTKDDKKHTGVGRYYPISEKIRRILNRAKEAQENANLQSDFVFSKKNAEYILPRDYEETLGNACISLGLNKHNNHSIRMYLNSYVLIPLGIDETDRAKLLGHSVETNNKYYSFEKLDYVDRTRVLLDKQGSEPQPNPCNEM